MAADQPLNSVSGRADESPVASNKSTQPPRAETPGVAALVAAVAAALATQAGISAMVSGRSNAIIGLLAAPVALIAAWIALRSGRRDSHRIQSLRTNLEATTEQLVRRRDMMDEISILVRTPLTGIQGFADTLVDMAAGPNPLDPAVVRDIGSVILNEALDLGRSIDDLTVAAHARGELAVSRGESDAAAEVESVLEPYRKTGLQVRTSCEPALIDTDRSRLRHVLRNLITNAVEHGGKNVSVLGRPAGPVYRIVIADDGPGLPEKVVEAIFGPGPDDRIPGRGLRVAKRIADETDCRLSYQRKSGHTLLLVDVPIGRGRQRAVQAFARRRMAGNEDSED